MKNERGSAVVMVLLFLGVLSMIGAGLLLQTQLDTQFTAAVHWSGTRTGQGDMAAATQFRNMPKNPDTTAYSGNPAVVSQCTNCGQTATTPIDYRLTDYRSIVIGDAPNAECAGFGGLTPITGGGYTGQVPFYWVAEGTGKAMRGGNPESTVQMACTKCK
ncbi:MAG: hypothetical protein HY913_08875 [Desulfomonile tiedjei]|nr:hypothetical protein [Desulfomonile tiedjei]